MSRKDSDGTDAAMRPGAPKSAEAVDPRDLAGMSREEKLVLLRRLAAQEVREKAPGRSVPEVPPGSGGEPGPYPVTFSQRRLWFLYRLDPEGSQHTIFRAYRLQGPLDRGALARALHRVVRRHEPLRTRFEEVEGEPRQVVEPAPSADDLVAAVDLTALPEAERDRRLAEIARREAARPFDLERGPTARFDLVRTGPEEWVLLVALHHIVADGWSLGILLRELSALYRSATEGAAGEDDGAAALPDLEATYGVLARAERERLQGEPMERKLESWRELLDGAPDVLDLPTDRPRPALETFRGTVEPFGLDRETTGRIVALAREERATPFMALFALFGAALGRWAGREDLLVGTPVAGRTESAAEPLIGYFANTLILRAELSGRPSFRELLQRTRRMSIGALSHQDMPFERLVEELVPERDLSRNPLFQVMFALQNQPAARLDFGAVRVEPLGVARGLSKVDLTLDLVEARGGDDGIAGYLEYNTDLFDRTTMRRFARALTGLARAVANEPDRPLAALRVLDGPERHALVVEWQARHAAEAGILPVHEAFAARAAEAPDAVAVEGGESGENGEDGGVRWTYRTLDRAAAGLAEQLSGLGVRPDGPERRIGVLAGRSLEAVVAFLGVLRSGGTYVPLDPEYPDERLAFMVEDAGVTSILVVPEWADRASALMPDGDGPGGGVLLLERDRLLTGGTEGAAGARVHPERAAYTIYTSGTTGRPKGVVVPHRALANHAAAIASAYGLTPADRVLQFASVSFDIAGEEIYPTLASGASLVLRPDELSLEPRAVVRFLARHRIAVANLPTPLWHEWCRDLGDAAGDAPESVDAEVLPPDDLRLVVVGTEAALPERLARWRAGLRAAGRGDLGWINAYGPTEATVTSLFHGVGGADSPRAGAEPSGRAERVPIGRPVSGLAAHVLDAELRPVPIGAAGELCLGGAGIARGYLDRPGVTADRFVPDPYDPAGGGRLYRTGDLARVRPDGAVDFLGRTDDQVKIRGFRIEPGEVEAVLSSHPAVRQTAVLALEAAPGDRRLVAYVVGEDGPAPETEDLAEFLGERLPPYMVPAAFVALDTLPMTPAGKVDRRELPSPDWTRGPLDGAREPLRGAVEELLGAIWCEVLEIDAVGAHDPFFRLGGHSLLATRLVARIRDRFGVEVPLRTVFEAPTVRRLARAVERARAGDGEAAAPELERAPRDEPIPASFAQQRLWFLDRLEPGSPQYNMPTRLVVAANGGSDDRVDAGVLDGAVGEIVARHESLRTVLAPGRNREDGAPLQVVREPVHPVGGLVPVIDLRALPSASEAAAADSLARTEARAPFDLEQGPLARFRLVRRTDRDELLFTAHHAVSDGWSTDLFLAELQALYGAFAAGRPSPLPALPVQYPDYAAWQRGWLRGEALERQIEHWTSALDGLPGLLELPSDRPRPPAPSGRGGRVRFRLPDAAARGVERLVREGAVGATPFMVLLAGFAAVLYRMSGQGDFGLGTPIAGRTRSELESLIGFFANTLVLRARLEDDPPFRELVERVRETALDAYAHQELPFEKLVEELSPERNLSHHPLFQVLFAYQDTVRSGTAEPPAKRPLRLRLLPGDNDTARFDLALNLWPVADGGEGGRGVAGYMEYASDLFDATTAARMVRHLGELLADAGQAPGTRVSGLALLTSAERQAVVTEWNDTDARFPEDRWPDGVGLHELVARQVAATPDAVALVDGADALTYRELDRRVAALADRLRGLGVGPGAVVGVCAERSLELVIALHAVVRAGGAYLPLDPDYPRERLAFMLDDAAVPVVLTQERWLAAELGETLRASGAAILVLDGPDGVAGAYSGAHSGALSGPGQAGAGPAPARDGDPDAAAYVIYTSGSTGRPKGVMVPHRGIVNRLIWMQRAYPLGDGDRVAQKTPFSFDVSVWELFWPFLVGARLEMAAPGRHGDPGYLSAFLSERRITTLHFVPSMLQVFLDDAGASGCHSVLRVIASGEALPASLAERFFERLPRAELHNLYGPTEASVDVSYHACRPGEEAVPIGRPIENIRLHVLDPRGRPAAIGVPGELHLGGVGLARCYLSRPGLTAERFVPDPFATLDAEDRAGARLYRTGDLCRWLPGGEVEFLGRIDFQVKVRGLRIELGEIEAVLTDHPAIREGVVVARDDGAGGARLVAYLVGHEGAEEPTVAALRSWVGETLPDYMIPSAFVLLDALPLSPNGKVDRRSLPDPGTDRPDLGREFVAPRTKVEEDLVAIWHEVLKVDRVGVEDNFFELGGHSLLATQVMTRIEERFQVELPLRAMFETPTVAGLGERIVESGLAEVDDDDLSRLLGDMDELSEDELAALLTGEGE